MQAPVLSAPVVQSAHVPVGGDGLGTPWLGVGAFETAVRKVFSAFEGSRDNVLFGRMVRAELLDRQGNVLATLHDPVHN
jgi:hypothetical protein